MKNTSSVLAVVLASVASFWLAGCAADASAPTAEEDKNVELRDPTPVPAVAAEAPTGEAHTQLRAAVKNPSRGGGGGGGSSSGTSGTAFEKLDRESDGDGCAAPDVTCPCGVCAAIDRCVAICEYLP